ncbi:MAG: PEP-CTERM sorting domain-containing protein [Tepidisphaeraceae bacterium]
MRREIITGLLMGLGAWQFLARSAGASIIGHSYLDNTVVTNPQYSWGHQTDGSGTTYLMNVSGDQAASSGQLVTSITTDTAIDPTLIVGNSVNNDTGFTWTGYDVSVSMSNPFTLSGALVSTPSDWSATVTPPALIGGQYVGYIDYSAGTPIPVGGTLDFQYTLAFSGGTNYSFTETVTPVPEPASLGLLTLGVVAMLGRRNRA